MTSTLVPIIQDVTQGKKTYLAENWYQVWKTTGEDSNGRLDSWLEVTPPQMGPPEHMHERYDESFWIVKGSFLFKIAGSTTTLTEGAWVFIPGGQPHTFSNIGPESGQLLIEAFPGGGMSKYFEEVSAIAIPGPLDPEALKPIDKRYGIVVVGPPLGADAH
jgi:mannose-6-phosphate isomerase-like protein (cupin superfamily)